MNYVELITAAYCIVNSYILQLLCNEYLVLFIKYVIIMGAFPGTPPLMKYEKIVIGRSQFVLVL